MTRKPAYTRETTYIKLIYRTAVSLRVDQEYIAFYVHSYLK